MAALQRKRRDLAVLKLIGYGPFWLAALPVGHVLAVAMGGLGLGLGFYAVAAGAINHLFAASLAAGETACRLPFELGLLVALATGLVALPAGGIAGWRAARVDPAEEIRDV
jgi:putative ABC transport system permease protein